MIHNSTNPIELYLTFDTILQPCSSALDIFFKDDKGISYKVFRTEFIEMIPLMKSGKIHGLFTTIKRSRAQGIKLIQLL